MNEGSQGRRFRDQEAQGLRAGRERTRPKMENIKEEETSRAQEAHASLADERARNVARERNERVPRKEKTIGGTN